MKYIDFFKERDFGSGSRENQDDYEEYRCYLIDNTMPGHQTVQFDLNAAGWKKLIKEKLDDLIKQELGMYPIKDYCWANEYKDGRSCHSMGYL